MTELYRGSTYEVSINDAGDGYQVTNLVTGIIEYKNASLPRCLIIFDESEDFMKDWREKSEKPVSIPKPTKVVSFPIPQREKDDA